MQRALIRWLVLAVAVWIAAAVVPGVDYDNGQSLLIAAMVLSILNVFVKPVLSVLSLPLIIVTLGLFMPVINALVLLLTAWLVPGFHVRGFWSAVGGSVVISLVGLFLGYPGRRQRVVYAPVDVDDPDRRGPPPGRGPIIDV